jgi:LuxR family maltose regulon positive regulatory protein
VASLAELHVRASAWLEGQGLGLEAFQHAAAAHDIDRATRLLESKGIPRQFRGTVKAILDWLGSLPASELDSRPGLQTMYASVLLATGQTTGIEEKLQAAETALHGAELDDSTRDLVGQIAAIRATLAIAEYQVDMMLAQSQRALEYLSPRSLFLRATAYWTMGVAYNLQGDRPAARQAYTEAIAISRASGDIFATILATVSLGAIQEADNQLYQAAETYRRVLELAGDMPLPIAGEAHLGLAHIHYEWNELEAALTHGQQSLTLSRQYESIIDRWVLCEVFLARLKLAHGDLAGAAAQLAQAEQAARQQHFVYRLPEIAAAQLVTWLQQGQVEAAAQLAQTYDLPLCQARVSLAQGDPAAAWIKLSAWGAKVEARGWADEQLRVRVLQALAYQAQGEQEQAVSELSAALALAEPGGYIRIFVDEGAAMQRLLSAVAAVGGRMPDYIGRILAGFEAHTPQTTTPAYPPAPTAQRLIDPLSPRELEVLHLIAQGRSDQEIAGQLFIALSTVKGHNRKIFGKLQVQRRTEAVARARDLGLL